MFIRHEGEPHWFLERDDGVVVDITQSQFRKAVPHHKAEGKGFLTKRPSKRARLVMARMR
jgi:hypothetical protein